MDTQNGAVLKKNAGASCGFAEMRQKTCCFSGDPSRPGYYFPDFFFTADFGVRTTAPSHGSLSVMNCF